ncbi:MAG TPA: flagellar hook capping FlgD N-terminal domain-containing protein [Bacillota bacterium]|nr:flagellar hook capping FlgD N-terminal domain-containing protein [Bacillota bacterium]HOL52085.1 flagellar hook capping FlgD N-terminal domain-containing protein [Bacillota bacterium]HPZ13868.1 flagellar hook capping FlgD N-terminal domain-containing protein [Bacillota bacterium]HQD80273.1 flagellar hook capping FlgD N-terminal domain-containing protein [Bacillota bacterium]
MYTSRAASVGTYAVPPENTPRKTLGKDEFLMLLITQMRNLDIGEGSSNQEFVAQMAQFTLLEEVQNLSYSVQELMCRQLIAEAGSFVGKDIEAWIPGYDMPVKGHVDSVEVIGGLPYLVVGDMRINMAHVTKIS